MSGLNCIYLLCNDDSVFNYRLTCILSIKFPNFQLLVVIILSVLSTILESENEAVKSCVGEGQMSKPNIQLSHQNNHSSQNFSYFHCKDQLEKSFYFRFAIVSLSVQFIYSAIYAIFRDSSVKFLRITACCCFLSFLQQLTVRRDVGSRDPTPFRIVGNVGLHLIIL